MSVLELDVPVLQPALTKQEQRQIKRVQRCALYIILGENYQSYEYALDYLECENLNDRRINLCEKFAKKCIKHPKYQHWFCQNTEDTHNLNTRNNSTKIKAKFTPVQTRTDRYQNSPLPYLTEILNKK